MERRKGNDERTGGIHNILYLLPKYSCIEFAAVNSRSGLAWQPPATSAKSGIWGGLTKWKWGVSYTYLTYPWDRIRVGRNRASRDARGKITINPSKRHRQRSSTFGALTAANSRACQDRIRLGMPKTRRSNYSGETSPSKYGPPALEVQQLETHPDQPEAWKR